MSIFSKLFKKQPKNRAELEFLIKETIEKKSAGCDLNFIDVSQITDMSRLFEESDFNGDISQWDVSNVTTMEKMFRKSKFMGDISQWNVSKVTNMEGCFSQSKFNGDISNWDVSNVTNMRSMFYRSAFNGDLSEWDVSNVTDMGHMFDEDVPFNGDISKWDVSNVKDMSYMFCGPLFDKSEFNGDISNWNVSKVTDMGNMFEKSKFNGDISKWDVSNVTNMECMFHLSEFNGDISNWNVSKVTDMGHMFEDSKFKGDIGKWNVSNVTDMQHMFDSNSFKCDLSNWDVSNVRHMKDMFSGVFGSNNSNIGDFSKWDIRNADDISSLFQMKGYSKEEMAEIKNKVFRKTMNACPKDCEELKSILKNAETCGIKDLNTIDISKITDMGGLFEGSEFNGDISQWDVSHVKNMKNMFHNSKFSGDISKWNVSNVTDMESMFEGSSFNGNISKWDVSKVENMTAMFKNSKFHGDISGWTLAPKSSGMFTNSGFSEEEINALLLPLCKPFTDPRDGETYRVCRIGDQIWMAENLRYRRKKGGSYAYDGDSSNVPKYGRLYTYEAAKESCPPGWHIPSVDECKKMMEFVGKEYDVGDALRAVEWKDGMDAFGFTALPAGDYSYYSDDDGYRYGDLGSDASFWLYGENADAVAGFEHGDHFSPSEQEAGYYDRDRRSIRCIKD